MDLIEKLIENGFLDKEKATFVETEAEDSGRPKEEILLEENIISQEELFNIKSEVTGIPLKKDIDTKEIEEDVFRLLHKDSASYYKMIPIGKEGDDVQIGMVYPENLRAREALKFISRKKGVSHRIYLITPNTLKEAIKIYDDFSEETSSLLIEEMIKEGIVEKEKTQEIEKEARERKKTVEEILLEKEIVSQEELFNIKSRAVDVPLKEDVNLKDISQDVISLINEDSASYYKMIPIGKEGNDVQIGMVYPENLRAQEALKFISRKNVFSYKVYLITLGIFEKIKQKYQVFDKDFGGSLMERLVERKFLEREQAENLEKEAESKNKSKEKILLEEGVVSEEDLFDIKSEITGVPLRKDIDVESIPEDVFSLFFKDTVNHYKMIPIGKEGDNIEVGMVYPEDSRTKDILSVTAEKKGFSYKTYLISFSDFKKINRKYRLSTREFELSLMEKLIEKGMLGKEKAVSLEEEAEKGEKTKEELILDQNLVPEEDLFNIKSEIVRAPFKNDFNPEGVGEDLLRLVPEDSANYYKMAPIGKEEGDVQIGMVYPENLRAQEALKFLARRDGFSHKVYLISLSTFQEISKQYRTLTKEVGAALEDLDEMEIEEGEEKLDMDADVGRLAEEAPIVKVVAVILKNAIEGSASDIHIEPTREKLKVRFRVDGILYSSLFLPMSVHLATIARIKILAGLKIDEQRLPQDGRFSTKVRGKSVDFRVSTFPTTLGEKAVIRVLDPTEGLKSIEELGVTEKNFQILNRSIKRPTGLTLVTGPTGSGKTTTLYSLLKLLNKENVNIVTLEDPVEYFMDGINQSQVHPDIGYVFSKGLRQILRQDPDVIMVGEIRDDETADLAIHAALTGHVVLSTLHTNNAAGVVPRLIDMKIKPFLIPPALNMAMSQRLVRRLCDKCKKEVEPTEEVRMIIQEELDKIPSVVLEDLNIPSPIKIYKAEGCKHCSEEGVIGRMGIFEVFSMTQELGEIVMKNPTEKELKEEAFRQGMITLKQDGMIKVVQGYTTIEEVLRATEEK